MKTFYTYAVTTAVLALLSFNVYSQCISTFPYYEDFEGATKYQDTSSCNTGIAGDAFGGWTQVTTDGGEWRADTAGTPSFGTGPGATDTSSGEGVGTDYSEGTTSGTYFYVESSGYVLGTSFIRCPGTDVQLLSPCFDLSGPDVYQLQFAYHMFGPKGMGTLHIDILDSNVWTYDLHVIKGNKGPDWQIATVNLNGFRSSSVRVQFRFTKSYAEAADCAIDAVKIDKFTPVTYDAEIVDMHYESIEYLMAPLKHTRDIRLHVNIRNNGSATMSSLVMDEKKNWNGSSSFDSIPAGRNKLDTFSVRIDHDDLGGRDLEFFLSSKEPDSDTTNNRFELITNLSDSAYARDDSVWTAGLGYGGTGRGQIGTMYELLEDDTVTSISFFLANPLADSTRAYIYEFTTAPGMLLATSQFVLYSSGNNWYTCAFSCPQILKKGRYFIAIEQFTAGRRIELACAGNRNFVENTNFYGNGVAWTEFKQGNNLIYTPLLRMNFGSLEGKGPDISIANIKDTICQDNSLTLRAAGIGLTGYEWSPAAAFSNPTSQFTSFRSDTTVTIRLKAWDQCNIPTIIERTIVVEQSPTGVPSPDTTICLGDQVHLRMRTNNSYRWQGGPSNQDYMATPIGDRVYNVTVDSSNGCSRTYGISVNTSTPDLKLIPDTVTCEGEQIVLYATGGVTYEWDNGTTKDKNPVAPLTSGYHYVTATNAMGCERTDSVLVLVDPAPPTKVSNDTSVCFGQRITLKVQGGVSNEWVGGPKAEEWSFIPLSTKNYIAWSYGQDGCIKRDTVHVTVGKIPVVTVREDTVICEGTSIDLEAVTPDNVRFIWNTGDTSRMINVSPLTSNRYRVRVFNEVGCDRSDSVMIFVSPLPLAGLELTQDGAKITIINKSQNGNSNLWDFGDGRTSNENNVVHTYTDNGDYTITLTVTNNCGTDDTSVTVTVNSISVETLVNELGVSIRPNPTGTGHFTVDLESNTFGTVYLVLTDMAGKELVRTDGNKNTRRFEKVVDVTGLSPGLYHLHVENNGGTAILRVMVR